MKKALRKSCLEQNFDGKMLMNLEIPESGAENYHTTYLTDFTDFPHTEFCKTCNSKSFSLHKKCPYSEFFWSVFSHIWNEYGKIRSISLYSVQMRENTDQKNSEHGHFSRSVCKKFVFSLQHPHKKKYLRGTKSKHHGNGLSCF